MKNLKALLDNYLCTVHRDEVNNPTQVEVCASANSPGLSMSMYGSFERDPLEKVELFSVQTEGYSEDLPDKYLDENRCYGIIESILSGNYRYELVSNTWWQKLVGGVVYLTIGPMDEPYVENFRCTNQSGTKGLFKAGLLRTQAYAKSQKY